MASNGIYFDHDANGFAEATGWLNRSDAFLAADRNGNGTIDSGIELFGDQTPLRSGAKAASGLQALAEWDSNRDGQIDAADTRFNDLRAWTDSNQDGISQANELQTLTDAGIVSISLAGSAIPNTAPDANGNTLIRTGSFTRGDGTPGLAGELLFQRDTALSLPATTYTVTDSIAAQPNFSGYGNLLDLHQALAKEVGAGDTALSTALTDYLAAPIVGAGDTAIRDTALDTLLYTWANAAGINPASRGGAMDARQITFLETAFGQSLGNPDSNAATQWRMSWHQVREYYGASLLAQTTLKPLFDQIQYSWDDQSQTLKADLSGVETLLQDGLALDAANGTTTGTAQLADFARAIKGLGAEDSVNYLALRETFVELDQLNGTDLAWTMDSAGMPVYDTLHTGQRAWSPHMEGTDGSEAVRGSLVEGDGYINSLYGHDTLWGTTRNEHLINEAGNSLLHGAGGGDTLNAGDGDDTLDGGTGNDILYGEAGNDTYIFRKGSGVDRIKGWNSGDRIWLAANPDQVSFKRNQDDLVIGFVDTPDKLIVENYHRVAQSGAVLGFRDGSTWDEAAIAAWFAAGAGAGNDLLIGSASADTLLGLAGNDQIAGNAGNDLIDGGTGNDLLIGAADYSAYANQLAPAARANGDDTYLFRRGDGNDVIADLDPTANTDTLRLIGIAPEELALSIANERTGWDGRTTTTLADIVIDLGLGESITLQGALSRGGAATGKIERIEFAASADAEPTLIWTDAELRAKLLAGTAIDNGILGWGDADRIDGGAGNDLLLGALGNDTLIGGEGSDTLRGEQGNDVMQGGAGDDDLNDPFGDNVLDGGEGSDRLFAGAGRDTLLGGAGNDQLAGNAGDDLIDGGGGDDTLQGSVYQGAALGDLAPAIANGNDSYVFARGYGNDLVIDRDRTAGNTDTIRVAADIMPDDVRLAHVGNDLVLSLVDAADTLTVRNWFHDGGGEWRVEQIVFEGGTTWNESQIMERAPLQGTAGNDRLLGVDDRDDVAHGLAGDDAIFGRGGNDTLHGDDGRDNLDGGAGGDLLLGGAGNDSLTGGGGNDVLEGGSGDDTLVGDLAWNSALVTPTAGDDIYRFARGDGKDTVIETAGGDDRVEFGAGITAAEVSVRHVGQDIVLSLDGGGDRVTLKNWADGGGAVVETVAFDDGETWNEAEIRRRSLTGGAGADEVLGYATNDLLLGNQGNDYLAGGGGGDTYLFHAGDGLDTVRDGTGNDRLLFGDVTADAATVGRQNGDLVLKVGAGDTVTVKDWFAEGAQQGVGSVEFAGGVAWDAAELRRRALIGSDGADVLIGYATDDVLAGGKADDVLQGGRGGDTYVYRRGDGQDTIIERDGTAGNLDTLHLADLNSGEVTLAISGFDLLLRVTGSEDRLRIANWFDSAAAQVEQIVFADGEIWDTTTIQSFASQGTNDDDTLFGSEADDTLDGGAGSDSIFGVDGNDVLIGGRDDDMLYGGYGANEYRIGRGEGFDQIWTQAEAIVAVKYPEQFDIVAQQLAAVDMEPMFQSDYWATLDSNFLWELPEELRNQLLAMGDGISQEEARAALSAVLDLARRADDVLVLGPGIALDDLSVQYQAVTYVWDYEWWRPAAPGRLALSWGDNEGVLVQVDGVEEGGYPDTVDPANIPLVGVRRVRFADGSEVSLEDLIARADGIPGSQTGDPGQDNILRGSILSDTIDGGEYNDVIDARAAADLVFARDGDDIIAGGRGADLLDGYSGNDVYAYNRGDGADVLENTANYPGETDTLSLGGGIRPQDVTGYRHASGELVLLLGADGDSVVVRGEMARVQFVDVSGSYRVFDLTALLNDATTSGFDDATLEAPFALFANAAAFEISGLAGAIGGSHALAYAQTGDLFAQPLSFDLDAADDVIDGSVLADAINAGDGNNVVRAGAGNDVIATGAGDDSVDAGSGDDVIDTGAGNDVILAGDGNDLIVAAGDGVIQAAGEAGDDTYAYQRGAHLVIDDAALPGAGNRLVFAADIAPDELRASIEDGQLVLRIGVDGAGGEVRFANFDPAGPQGSAAVDRIVFDGIEFGWSWLLDRGINVGGGEGDDIVVGGGGGDRMSGHGGNDVIIGGRGDDVLRGGEGDDSYLFGLGDGADTIVDNASAAAGNTVRLGAGITAGDLALSIEYDQQAADGSSIVTVHIDDDAGDSLSFAGLSRDDLGGNHPVAAFRFADDSVLSWSEVMDFGFRFEGAQGDFNHLVGTDRNDDFVVHGIENTMLGGTGDDTYWIDSVSSWNAIVDDSVPGAGNTLQLGAGMQLEDARLQWDGGWSLLLAGWQQVNLSSTGVWNDETGELVSSIHDRVVDSFVFADGAAVDFDGLLERGVYIQNWTAPDGTISGTPWKDFISGTAEDDVIDGGTGGDTLEGFDGDDTYVFNRGDGKVMIKDVARMDEGNTLRFGAGIALDDMVRSLRFTAPANGMPGELIIRLGDGGDEVHIAGFDPEDPELGAHGVENFAFADGSVISFRQMIRNTFVVQGGADDDSLLGTALGDRLYGYEGSDLLAGSGGDDVLTGGIGDDAMAGGDGNDVYILDLGSGNDTVLDSTLGASENLLVFGSGITRDSLSFISEADGLRVRYSPDDSVLLLGWSPVDGEEVVRAVEFADGSQESLASLLNAAPVVALTPADISAVEDAAFSWTLPEGTFVDPDFGDALTYTVAGVNGTPLPEWVSFDAGSLTLSGSPRNGDVGGFVAEVTASDRYGKSATASFAVQVDNSNDAPVVGITLPNALQATEDSPFEFVIPAGAFSDVDAGDTLSLGAALANDDPLPAWLMFDVLTGRFSGTPGNVDVGSLAVKVTAVDGAGDTASQVFALDVANSNDAPEAGDAIDAVIATQGSVFAFTVPATAFRDIDVGDSLTLSVSLANGDPLPAWLSFDAVTGSFSGMPLNGDVGAVSVVLTATDAVGTSATQAFLLSVISTNNAPEAVGAIAPVTAAEDSAFAFTVPATAFRDADVGDTLTLSASAANGDPLPAWLSFDAATGSFSGTPLNEDVGSISVAVVATDAAGESASQVFALTVGNANDAPELGDAIAPVTASEDSAFAFTVPAAAFRDADVGETLTLSASVANGDPLPAWLSFDAATGSFSGTPLNEDVGVVSVAVVATDAAGAAASQTFALNIANTNDAPTPGAAISSAQATEDAAFLLALPANSFVDVDPGETLALSASLTNGDPLPAWLTFDALTGTFSGTPSNDDVGSVNVEVSAVDGDGATANQAFRLDVFNSNDAPEAGAAIAALTATEGSALAFHLPATAFRDIDVGDTLTFSATLTNGDPLPAWLAFDAAAASFSGTPQNYDVGSLSVTVTATDAVGAAASQTFALTVANTNDAPTVGDAIPAALATEDSAFGFVVPSTAFHDADLGDALSYGATLANGDSLPAWLSFDVTSRTISGTPGNDDVGAFSIIVTATDTAGASASQAFALNVANTNDAPVVGVAIGSVSATEDSAFEFVVPDTALREIDAGDSLAFTVTSANGDPLPAWLAFDPATRSFSGTPTNADVGTWRVTLTATDAAGSAAAQTFDIAVENTNDTPVTADDSGAVVDGLVMQTSGNVLLNDSDPDVGDVLTVADAGVRQGSLGQLSLAASGAWTYQLDPTLVRSLGAGETAVEHFGYVAHDGQVAAPGVLDIAVGGSNDAPVLASPLAGAQANVGALFSWNLPVGAFLDPDANDVLGYGASQADGSPLPGWLSVDAATGALAGTPGAGDAGQVSVMLTATDGSGAAASGSMTLTVAAVAAQGQTFVGTTHSDTLTGTEYNDVFDGRAGVDTLIGRGGDDVYLVTDQTDNIVEQANGGFDTVWADSGFALPDHVEGLAFVGRADYAGNGNSLNNLLAGNRGDNRLDGKAGDDILFGRAGDDTLLGGMGSDALDGGSGDDVLDDGDGVGFVAGGRGKDVIRLGSGVDVIAFNRGDDVDRIQGGDGQNDVLSLGDIRISDIRLQKAGKDLIVDVGRGDSLRFADWYKNSGNRTIATLQVATNFSATLFDRYDFAGLVRKFDSVRTADHHMDSWRPGSDALRFKLESATSEVAGGSLAATYASTGTLNDTRPESVTTALATPLGDATAISSLPEVFLPPQLSGHGNSHDDRDGHGSDDGHDHDDRIGWQVDTGSFLRPGEVEVAWQSWLNQIASSPSASPIDYAMGWARLRDKLAGRHDEGDWGGAWCNWVGGNRHNGLSLPWSGQGGIASGSPIGLRDSLLRRFEGLKEGFERLD